MENYLNKMKKITKRMILLTPVWIGCFFLFIFLAEKVGRWTYLMEQSIWFSSSTTMIAIALVATILTLLNIKLYMVLEK